MVARCQNPVQEGVVWGLFWSWFNCGGASGGWPWPHKDFEKTLPKVLENYANFYGKFPGSTNDDYNHMICPL